MSIDYKLFENKLLISYEYPTLMYRIRLETCDFERRKRMWQTGLAQAMYKPPVTNSIPRIIEMRLLEPITREFCRKTGQNIHYRRLVPDTRFHLLCQSKPFALISLPNPSTGRVFIQYLNESARRASPLRELRNTDEISSFLQERFPK